MGTAAMRLGIVLVWTLVAGVLGAGQEEVARAASYPLPFDPFIAGESFGCKHLLIPGAELLPHDPVIDPKLLPGWRTGADSGGKARLRRHPA